MQTFVRVELMTVRNFPEQQLCTEDEVFTLFSVTHHALFQNSGVQSFVISGFPSPFSTQKTLFQAK